MYKDPWRPSTRCSPCARCRRVWSQFHDHGRRQPRLGNLHSRGLLQAAHVAWQSPPRGDAPPSATHGRSRRALPRHLRPRLLPAAHPPTRGCSRRGEHTSPLPHPRPAPPPPRRPGPAQPHLTPRPDPPPAARSAPLAPGNSASPHSPTSPPPTAAPFDPVSREFILSQLRGEIPTLAVILLSLAACTACTTVTPLLSSAFFESLLGRLPADQFYTSVALLTCCYVLEALATLVYVRCIFRLSERAFEKIRVETFRALLVQRRERH